MTLKLVLAHPVLMLYGLDNGRYPSPTVYSFGLNVSF